eukprot:symbB.v1.2.003456.t1/scaffold194.1/size275082/17
MRVKEATVTKVGMLSGLTKQKLLSDFSVQHSLSLQIGSTSDKPTSAMDIRIADISAPCRPPLPEDDEPSPSPNLERTGLSVEFELLLKQLVNLHLSEVAQGTQQTSQYFTADPSGFSSYGERETSKSSRARSRGSLYSLDAEQILYAWQESDLSAAVHEEVKKPQRTWTFDILLALVFLVDIVLLCIEQQLEGLDLAGDLNLADFDGVVQPPSQWWKNWRGLFAACHFLVSLIYVLDVVAQLRFLGCKFWKLIGSYADLFAAISGIAYMVLSFFPVHNVWMHLCNVGRLARAFRLVDVISNLPSLHLLSKCLLASRFMLFWAFILLALFQAAGGMFLSNLSMDFVRDPTADVNARREVFRYYGTFSRSFLTMFEVLFANWGPPCRVLVDNISQWYTLFFLIFRCVFGFAILNVLNAVFVNQTLRTASGDEELAFKQRQRDLKNYQNKVQTLFRNIDASGDGAISKEEFSKLVESPMLQFWMGQLELEYHDLMSLFEFLDPGDGQITLQSLMEGAFRLRGGAKALDIWRMETKLELLFAEILAKVDGEKGGDLTPIFQRSGFHSLKTSTYS